MKKISKNIAVLYRFGHLALTVVLAITVVYMYNHNLTNSIKRDRDIQRISAIGQIRTALAQYYEMNSMYPACLYKKDGCPSLEGTTILPTVPRDPLTNNQYTYAAFGSGNTCANFHLGVSLERRASQALLTGADAPPKKDSQLCQGSAPDFSGLSFVVGGEQCNTVAGIAQPTDAANGETCFDLSSRRAPN